MLKLDIAMFGRKINRNKSVGGNIKGSSLVPWLRHVCILRTHVREEETQRCIASVCVDVHSWQDGGRSGPETDSPWTHQCIIACKKGIRRKGWWARKSRGAHKDGRTSREKEKEAESTVAFAIPKANSGTRIYKKRLVKREKKRNRKRERYRRIGIFHSSCLGPDDVWSDWLRNSRGEG